MNLAALFGMLLQMGVCAPVDFNKPDHSQLRVIVCPMNMAAPKDKTDPGAGGPTNELPGSLPPKKDDKHS